MDPLQTVDPGGFAALLDKISSERAFSCGSYKERCLRRRVAVRMRANAVHTFSDYMHVLDVDATEYDRLLDALTINVTKLFRNWETYDSVARRVVPSLWAEPDAELRVWSAGCSSGEEPYSLAVLFHRHAQSMGAGDRSGRVRVLGTDIDRASLEAAERGSFVEASFPDTPPELRARYFSSDLRPTVVPEVRSMVRFERNDLLREEPPAGGHHLIACRNVIIYFERDTQARLFERFHSALVPGGYLVLGKVETLLGRARDMFAVVDARERIFRRL